MDDRRPSVWTAGLLAQPAGWPPIPAPSRYITAFGFRALFPLSCKIGICHARVLYDSVLCSGLLPRNIYGIISSITVPYRTLTRGRFIGRGRENMPEPA